MIADRPFPAAVSIALLDGRGFTGHIAQFSPRAPDITIEDDEVGEAEGGPHKTTLRGELIAFVAFRSGLGVSPARPETGLRAYRLHLVGGKIITVEADADQVKSQLGFYAFPSEAEWDVREYFFYAHGIVRRELDEPLGSMLVVDGSADRAGVQRGLAVQSAQRKKTLGEILVEQERVERNHVDEALALQRRRKLSLGVLLVEAGVASQADVDAAVAEQQRRRGKRLGEILVEQGILGEEGLMRALSRKFDLPFVDLDEHQIEPGALAEVPRTIIENLGVLPIYADAAHVIIAIGDPLAFQAADMLRTHCRKRIVEVLAAPSQLRLYVARAMALTDDAAGAPAEVGAILRELAEESVANEPNETPEDEAHESDGAVVRLVNRIVIDAHAQGASDIHIEPNGTARDMVIRFRVDGECILYHDVPSSFRQAVVARLKIMAGLDIAERRRPQDGKIRFRLGPAKTIELRVATLPTVADNEDVVLRILADQKPLPLEKMGLSTRNLAEFRAAIKKSYGLILCVGPTGSGKTTTLHSALGEINTTDMKIWTAEDPVEITQPGLRQVQVQPKIGVTFAIAMRAFLRADPDVIMVGEMRDHETAQIAVEASLTGHLVLSTLHTNSAPETITRLLDMGLDPFSFSDALLVVIAQRLARGLCPQCKRAEPSTSADLDVILAAYGPHAREDHPMLFQDGFTIWRAVGCKSCGNSGYRGRIAIHELLVSNDEIRRAVAQRARANDIRDLAIAAGMTTLMQDGIEKALAGKTDLTQVLAVCSK